MDLLNGTPVLDIKPYIPEYDCVDAAVVPSWVTGNDTAMASVQWRPEARAELQAAAQLPGTLITLDDAAHVECVIEQVLACDIRSGAKRQRDDTGDRGSLTLPQHKLALDRLEIIFEIGDGKQVVVRSVRSTARAPKSRPASIPTAVETKVPPTSAVPTQKPATLVQEECLCQMACTVAAQRGPDACLNVLVLGDGDFSFAEAVLRRAPQAEAAHGGKLALVATSLDSIETLRGKYGAEAMDRRLSRLRDRGAIVEHQIDATDLHPSLQRMQVQVPRGDFDCIIFQFPLGAPAASREEFETSAVPADLRTRHLIWATLRGAAEVLAPEGELWIAAKKDSKYDMRHFVGARAAAIAQSKPNAGPALVFARQWLFDATHYPGYVTRNVQNNGSFPIEGALSYAFVHPKSERLKFAQQNRSLPNPGPWDCKLCTIQCGSEGAAASHASGKNHTRLAALERQWEAYCQNVKM